MKYHPLIQLYHGYQNKIFYESLPCKYRNKILLGNYLWNVGFECDNVFIRKPTYLIPFLSSYLTIRYFPHSGDDSLDLVFGLTLDVTVNGLSLITCSTILNYHWKMLLILFKPSPDSVKTLKDARNICTRIITNSRQRLKEN